MGDGCEGLIELDEVLSGGEGWVRIGGGWRQSAGETAGARAAVSNLLKNRFNSLAPAILPSAPLLVGLKPVMVLIPLQTSLILFCWSFHSSFLLYLSLASLIFEFSSPLLPLLKALFFQL